MKDQTLLVFLGLVLMVLIKLLAMISLVKQLIPPTNGYAPAPIMERRFAGTDQATSDLSLEAAKRALENAQVQPEEIDLVLVATITRIWHFRHACILQHKLGLNKVPVLT